MPKLIAVSAVTVVRDGERVTVTPGQLFDFTAEELKDIEKSSSPEVQIVRKPINETKAEAEDGGDDPDTTKTATKTAAANKPASKTAAKKNDDL
ncbi:hypothetical protein AXY1_64 [Achromobacter phage AXY1]|nr:hypothetical protein AXY1_64 [Achromobacter phage AXY1]